MLSLDSIRYSRTSFLHAWLVYPIPHQLWSSSVLGADSWPCTAIGPHHGNAAVLPILWFQPALLLVQTGFQELDSLKEVLKSSLKLKIADVLEAAEVKFKLPQGLLAVGKYFEYRSVQNTFAVKDHSWKKHHILITAIYLIKYNRFTISWTIDW